MVRSAGCCQCTCHLVPSNQGQLVTLNIITSQFYNTANYFFLLTILILPIIDLNFHNTNVTNISALTDAAGSSTGKSEVESNRSYLWCQSSYMHLCQLPIISRNDDGVRSTAPARCLISRISK